MKNPTSRRAELEEQWVDDELVIYDLRTDRAHCLHPLTARVRELADGTRSASAIVADVTADPRFNASADAAWATFDALADADLLDSRVTPPGAEVMTQRRKLIRGVLAASALGAFPFAIRSILAPTPAQAQSAPSGGGDSEATQKELESKMAESNEKEGNVKSEEERAKSGSEGSSGSGGSGGSDSGEQASKEETTKEQSGKEETTKEQQAKGGGGGEEAAKEEATKEQRAKSGSTGSAEQLSKEQSSKEQAAKEQQAKIPPTSR